MTTDNAEVNPQNSLALIASALKDPDCDPAKLQQLLVVKKEWETDEARKSFAVAFVNFQAACPTVKKGRIMRDTIAFAGKADIEKVIKPVLAEHGLSVSITKSKIENGNLSIEGFILHRDGHMQPLQGEVVVDKKMSANDTQKIGSAMSYAWRYMICPALNITLDDQVDDDGQSAGGGLITQDQADEIEKYLGNLPDSTRESVLKLAQCESIDQMQTKWFDGVVKKLKLSIDKQDA